MELKSNKNKPIKRKKTMNILLSKLSVLLLILINTTSCMVGDFGIKGNGNIVSENRKINTNFNQIKVSNGIQVYLTQSKKTSLSVDADENIIDLLITKVEGNVLNIYLKKNVNRGTRKVHLNTKELKEITASSGASVRNKNTFKTSIIAINTSSGSSVNLHLNANTVDCKSSSGSNIKLNGLTNTLNVSASSGSSISTFNLETKTASVKSSSGANIKVFTSKNLTAKASSGSSIDYYGNPTSITKSNSSGGSISKN